MGNYLDSRLILTIFNPLLILSVIAAMYTNSYQESHHTLWANHGMNLLAMPIYLYTASVCQKLLRKRHNYLISTVNVTVIFCAISILFEWILPYSSGKYHSDGFDVIAYAIGSFIIYPIVERAQLFAWYKR